jgi:hypothetical protein
MTGAMSLGISDAANRFLAAALWRQSRQMGGTVGAFAVAIDQGLEAFGLFDGMHVGARQVLGDLRVACFLVGHGADHARRGGQAGDRGDTQAAVAEGRSSWPAVEPSTPLMGGGTIGRASSSWIRPSALMVVASSLSIQSGCRSSQPLATRSAARFIAVFGLASTS